MPGDEAASNPANGKISWKDMHDILQDINKRLEAQSTERAAMETRLLRELACKEDVETLRADVEVLKRNSYIWNGVNSVFVTLGAIIFGSKQ